MNDFISRESAVKAITEYKVKIESENMPEITKCCFQMLNITCDKNIGFINSIPAADVQPVKRGVWKEHTVCVNRNNGTTHIYEYSEDYMTCSNCWHSFNYCDNDTERFNYCPNCGALMQDE